MHCLVIWHKLRQLSAAWLCSWIAIAFGQSAEDPASQTGTPSSSVYRNVSGRELRVFELPPAAVHDAARPAILFVQGGAWTRGRPDQLFRTARHFAENGFMSVVGEYRLADKTNSPVESFSDVCHALGFVRKNAARLRIDPSKVALWGISSSGQLTASAATAGCDSDEGSAQNGGPDALLLVSPVVDAVADGLFRDLMKGHGKPSSLSPMHTLSKAIVPTHIVQGDADKTTPIERSKLFCERARGLGSRCEVVTLEGQGHVLDKPARDGVLTHQVRFLQELWR